MDADEARSLLDDRALFEMAEPIQQVKYWPTEWIVVNSHIRGTLSITPAQYWRYVLSSIIKQLGGYG